MPQIDISMYLSLIEFTFCLFFFCYIILSLSSLDTFCLINKIKYKTRTKLATLIILTNQLLEKNTNCNYLRQLK
jgi:hypothetical protein